MTRAVQKGDEAYSGETITVAEKSQSQIMLSDGSTLDLFANSRMALAKLKQTNGVKNFFFKLGLGKVYATVTKLMNSNSSFEVDAGGIVCGVRGTEFSVDYDPATNKVGLNVVQGVVAAGAGGQVQNITAGQHVTFINGHSEGNPLGSGPTSKTTGKPAGGTNTGNGQGNSQGGNNTGGSSNSGSNGNAPPNGNGGTNSGSSSNGGVQGGSSSTGGSPTGTSETGTGTTNPSSSSAAPPLDTNSALGDLNSQFTTGILVNTDNNFNSAQQTLTIHLVVPGREVGP